MTSIPTTPSRRRFLQALGLGAAAIGSSGISFGSNPVRAGGPPPPPTRVVFFITPHGTIWNQWKMPVGGSATAFSERAITGLGSGDWPAILAPLASYQNDLLVVEGLSRTTVQVEEYENTMTAGNCNNRHHVAQAHLLTCVRAMQRSGSSSIGGGQSIDQHIGRLTTGSGRWASRVYGFSHQHPYNFVAAGEEAPRVQDPRTAFNDILGLYVPPTTGTPTRDDLIRAGRGSVLDLVANEYELVAPRLGRDDRLKLERHRDLLRDLELTFSGGASGVACDPTFTTTGNVAAQFARINALALSCDLTRVVTYVTQGIDSAGLGLPADTSIHQDYAHNSIENSGGSVYTAEAERGMVAYNVHYANQFAAFLRELDSTPDGAGESLLDHTAVVWLTELATGTHEIIDTPIVVAGGANGAFRTGRYVRYPMNNRIHQAYSGSGVAIGPSTSQLYVSLMNAMGVEGDSFGMTEARAFDGSNISLRGPLAELG